jgi:hypothetical protein
LQQSVALAFGVARQVTDELGLEGGGHWRFPGAPGVRCFQYPPINQLVSESWLSPA